MNTSRSLSVDRLEIRHVNERLCLEVQASSGERDSRILEIQLIDELVVGKTNRDRYVGGGFGCECWDRKKTKKRKKRKSRRKRRRRRSAWPLSLARSLAGLVARAFLRALCTTELGGLGFLRTTRGFITPGLRAAPRATPFARLWSPPSRRECRPGPNAPFSAAIMRRNRRRPGIYRSCVAGRGRERERFS